MRPQVIRASSLAIALVAGLVSCGGDEPGLTCAENTVLEDGACVAAPELSCGVGTVRAGDRCIPEADAGSPPEDVAEANDVDDVEVPPADLGPGDGAEADAGPDAEDLPDCEPPCPGGTVCFQSVCVEAPVPDTWFCTSAYYGDGEECDCSCGAPDPDCKDPALPVTGCVSSSKCDAEGVCAECAPECAGKECGDDGCGYQCGYCLVPGEDTCVNGTCQACVPDCGDRVCGPDGCGGECGVCELGFGCLGGHCELPEPALSCSGHCGEVRPAGCSCTAYCAADDACCVDVGLCGCLPKCAALECGDDGCGGSCGDCQEGLVCWEGSCLAPTCVDSQCGDHGACHSEATGCDCDPGYAAPFCAACAVGFADYPQCKETCAPGDPCGDGDACTIDACDPATGCVHTAGGPCEDESPCTADHCDPAIGCVYEPVDGECTLTDACALFAACVDGACTAVASVDCDDEDPCTVDACDATTAECSHAPAAAGAVCDDQDLCSAGETCDAAGACGSGKTICTVPAIPALAAHYTAAAAHDFVLGPSHTALVWRDRLGTGDDLIHADVFAAPVIDSAAVNGHPGVRISESGGLEAEDVAHGTSLSIVAVACGEADAPFGPIVSFGGWILEEDAATLRFSAGAETVSLPADLGDGCRVLAARAGPDGLELCRTGRVTTCVSGAGIALAPGADTLRVGHGEIGSDVLLGELLVVDGRISTEVRDAALTYLRTAWSFEAPAPDVAWFSATSAGTLTLEAGRVLQWSGAGAPAVAPPNAAPLWLADVSGHAGVRFQGEERLLTPAVAAGPAWTIFAAFALEQAPPGARVLSAGDATLRLVDCSGCGPGLEWSVAGGDAPAAPIPTAGWTVAVAMQDGTSSTLYAGGGAPGTTTQGPLAGSAALTLGNAADGTAPLSGVLGELRIYGTILSPPDRAFTEASLRRAFGL